ncbi:hypothetical protein AHiyo8_58950 [Arthrobacter sp. Hiyo8]|uniref:hypothetical protein n=1 Tax=Arthrobacter sp. Hiyo1 TaxID=1588020 RepID=UPI0006839A0B|nr:hypothetical protein [Arthrobacter sp. Hiyo1]BAS17592.1 hypothetical protein AHiyo8_58950 [Arthrobacter sp. Hiyo8]GAP57952.1 hypothetical protein AHiyo1_09140 [Arthrobacter sp. Hiyo1]
MGKPLTEQQFNTITAQLRKKSNDIAKVAEASGLKVSTIKAVRRAQTWENYQEVRKAQGEKIKALHQLNKIAKTGPTEPAQPLIHEIKPVAKKAAKVDLEKILKDQSYMLSELAKLAERLGKVEEAVSETQHDAIVSDINQRRTFLARFRREQR